MKTKPIKDMTPQELENLKAEEDARQSEKARQQEEVRRKARERAEREEQRKILQQNYGEKARPQDQEDI